MSMPLEEKRQIGNEMIFRRANEQISIGLDKVDAQHIDKGEPQLVRSEDYILHFLCECSDETCVTRIPMTISSFKKIHLNRGSFIIKLKHQVKSIEKVVRSEADYSVVEKNHYTTEPHKELNNT